MPTGQYEINIFKPCSRSMRRQIRRVALVLDGWLLAIVGSQALVYALEHVWSSTPLARYTLFNLPFSYWLTGQFLPLWFIVMCALFNLWMDRHGGRGPDVSLRFRMRDGQDREA